MKRLLKYIIPAKLSGSNAHKIEMPRNANILKVSSQNTDISIWAEVDESQESEIVGFMCLYTGDPKPSNASQYLDTVFFNDKGYVLHVYKLLR